MKALKGYRGLDPSPRQLAAYCGGCAFDHMSVECIKFRSVRRGRTTDNNTHIFPGRVTGSLTRFIRKGRHRDFPFVFVRYVGGVQRPARVRFSENLVDVITEDNAIVASFRL